MHETLSFNMGEGRAVASQVCLHCKLRKRRCSKGLPSCALCTKLVHANEVQIKLLILRRLLVQCDYEYGPSRLHYPEPRQPTHNSQSRPTHEPVAAGLTTAARLISDMSLSSLNSMCQEMSIHEQILEILISNDESVPSVISKYFQTVDTWLPILYPKSFQMPHDVELSSLLLSMYLITRSPTDELGGARSLLYFQVKALHSALIFSGKASIDVVQAGVLITIYEQGHGMTEVAQMTLSTSSRIAIKMLGAQRSLVTEDIENTELGRVWWAIVMIDR